MAVINMEAILNKARKYVNSPEFKKKMSDKVDEIILYGGSKGKSGASMVGDIYSAADKFIEVLKGEIESSSLGATAIAALTQLEKGTAQKTGDSRYKITVSFSGDLHRDSLAPAKYSGVDNIAALLNNGYKAGNAVYGIWEGHTDQPIASLTMRDGAHFVSSAVNKFMSGYSKTYSVIDIEVNEAYE